MQHELFCSIVPPEQLFVPVHPTPLLSGSHPLLFYEATATHTHYDTVHLWAVTQQCWACGFGDQKAWGSPPSQPRVPLWLDHRQKGTLLYTEPQNAQEKKKQHPLGESAHMQREPFVLLPFPAAQIQHRRKVIRRKWRPFFSPVLLKHSLAVTLNTLSVSLDCGGCTCSSCDSNEGMALQ